MTGGLRQWLLKGNLGLLLAIGFALAAFGCGGGAPGRVDTSGDYDGIVRTGYFDGPEDPADWRTAIISREQAHADLAELATLLEHRYPYNDADDLDEDAALAAIDAYAIEFVRRPPGGSGTRN